MEGALMIRIPRLAVAVAALVAVAACSSSAHAIGTAFTYQGRLDDLGVPANSDCTFHFALFTASAGGTLIGVDDTPLAAVEDGLFTVVLDFGAVFDGSPRWLEISVFCTGDAGYTTLSPRQEITAVPYAIRSGFAENGGPGGSQWISDGPDLSYSQGSVGFTGHSAPFASGNGVFIEGGYGTWGHIFAANYDNGTPLPLWLNYPSGKVAVGNVPTIEAQFQVNSSNETAIIGRHTGNWVGVYGESQSSVGVWGKGINWIGVQGTTGGASSAGVYGECTNAAGYGGIFRNTAGGLALWVDGKATVKTLEIQGGADIVEGFETGEHAPEPGTVVVIDERYPGELRPSDGAYDHRVAGVVSGAGGIAPGLRLGQAGMMDGETPVAMSGRVYVRCSAENGPIQPGDLLTTATEPGHAMKATSSERSHGTVIGKAMTSLDRGTGLVLVLVNLH
jgi:hypothetical protein